MSGKDALEALVTKIRQVYAREMGMEGVADRQRRLVTTNWQVGMFIVESEQDGAIRAEYGTRLVNILSDKLKYELGVGFSERNLQYSRAFYCEYEISQTSAELSWSHYVALLSVPDRVARDALEQQAILESLPIELLKTRVQATNQRLARTNGTRKPLVPRAGRMGLCKVVERRRGNRTVRLLDMGFWVTHPITARQGGSLFAGEIVDWNASQKSGGRLVRVACEAGERYCFEGYLQGVVDGDTLLMEMMLVNGTTTLQRLRLRAVMAEELGTEAGERAKKFVERLINIGDKLKIFTYGHDRYGRYVADVFCNGGFVNQQIIEAGLG